MRKSAGSVGRNLKRTNDRVEGRERKIARRQEEIARLQAQIAALEKEKLADAALLVSLEEKVEQRDAVGLTKSLVDPSEFSKVRHIRLRQSLNHECLAAGITPPEWIKRISKSDIVGVQIRDLLEKYVCAEGGIGPLIDPNDIGGVSDRVRDLMREPRGDSRIGEDIFAIDPNWKRVLESGAVEALVSRWRRHFGITAPGAVVITERNVLVSTAHCPSRMEGDFLINPAEVLASALHDLSAAVTAGRGLAAIEEASVARYREILKNESRERDPANWARTQSSLATALCSLGEKEDDTSRFEEAVDLYRQALTVRPAEPGSFNWAATQNALGAALFTLGRLQDDTARLEEAVVAYREALTVTTREQMPREWAGTHANLGLAIGLIGERENDAAKIQESVSCFRQALDVRRRDRAPLEWAMTQTLLGRALCSLAECRGETTSFVEAIAVYREALKEWTPQRDPLEWAETQDSLGRALLVLGELERNVARFEEAIPVYRQLLALASSNPLRSWHEIAGEGLAMAQALLERYRNL